MECLEITINDKGIAEIALNRPAVNNAFNSLLIAELTIALDILKDDKKVAAILLKGKGKHFSAGADLNWMRQSKNFNLQENEQDAKQLSILLKKLYDFPKATVCYVHGACYAGAVGIVSCCDVVLADVNAKFCLSEVKLGLIPAIISPYVLNAIGLRQALRFMQTAEIISAEKALAIGLVHELIFDTKANFLINDILTNIINNAPQAMIEIKKLLKENNNQALNEEFREMLVKKIASIRVSVEAQEGITAFLEKRKPEF